MNYKSQLKAWAIDRAIELFKVDGDHEGHNLHNLKEIADSLVSYAYVGEEDFKDACRRMTECLKGDEDALAKVDAVINEMQYLKEQMQHALGLKAALSEPAKGAA